MSAGIEKVDRCATTRAILADPKIILRLHIHCIELSAGGIGRARGLIVGFPLFIFIAVLGLKEVIFCHKS